MPAMPIMTHYRHLLRWIDSSNTLEQLMACDEGISSFRKTHNRNIAIRLLADDLHTLCWEKHSGIAKIELINLQLQQDDRRYTD
jgi:hypothetical protein